MKDFIDMYEIIRIILVFAEDCYFSIREHSIQSLPLLMIFYLIPDYKF